MSEVPIMQVNLAGEYGLVRLKDIAEDLQEQLEQIPEVLRVDVRGGLEREVQVNVQLSKIQFYNLALQDVIDAIAWENVNIPGGSIDVGDLKYLVRVDGEFDDPSMIEDLVITADGANPVYIRDVADVEFGFAERESYARLDGAPVVTLDVVKRSGRNIIETAEKVKATIDRMSPDFPPTTSVKITGDTSKDIFMMVSSLENNILSGLILIVGVLLFFLGLRTSIFVAVSIPSSMLLSFVVLRLMGTTMNMVVLFSLILALGMLVDNAIVVVENIYRYIEQGWDRKLAAKKATGEVAVPVIAATLTTLAAFAPPPLLAGHDRGVHEVPPPDAHRHALQLAFRGAGHHPDVVLDVPADRRRGAHADAAGDTCHDHRGDGRSGSRGRGGQPSYRGVARPDCGGHLGALPLRASSRGIELPTRRTSPDHHRL